MIGYLALAMFLGFVLFSLIKPKFAVILVIGFFPLEQVLRTAVPQFKANPALANYIVGLVAVAAVILRLARNPQGVFRAYFNPGSALVFAMYAYAIAGALYSPVTQTAFEALRSGVPYHVLMLLILPGLISSLEEFRRLLMPFIFFGLTIMTIVVGLVFVSPDVTIGGGRLFIRTIAPDGTSELQNPLELGTLGGLVAIAAALYVPLGLKGLSLPVRLGAFLFGLGFALVTARGQFLFAAASVVLLFPLSRGLGSIRQIVSTATGLTVVGVLGLLVVRPLLSDETTGARYSAEQLAAGAEDRLSQIGTALSVFERNPTAPLLGGGTLVYAESVGDPTNPTVYPHNLPVQILTEHGLVGVAIFGGAIVVIGVLGVRCYTRGSGNPVAQSVVVVLGGFLLYELLLSLKQGSFVTSPKPTYMMMLVARVFAGELAGAWEPSAHAALHDDPYDEPMLAEA